MRKRVLIIISIVVSILLIPLIAMQFTDEVVWELSDFIVGGAMLFSLGLLIDFILRLFSKSKYKIVIIIAVLIVFVLLWMELAVGFLGSHIAGS